MTMGPYNHIQCIQYFIGKCSIFCGGIELQRKTLVARQLNYEHWAMLRMSKTNKFYHWEHNCCKSNRGGANVLSYRWHMLDEPILQMRWQNIQNSYHPFNYHVLKVALTFDAKSNLFISSTKIQCNFIVKTNGAAPIESGQNWTTFSFILEWK